MVMFCTFITPVVRVPVLSKIAVSIFVAISIDELFRRIIPLVAPLPDATRSATGVASPRAQGQAIINTATDAVMESVSEFPRPYQEAKVAIASAITMGTNILLIRSASLWIGAFSP